ncbi:DUF2798 domain-containing protein [Pseudoalteromonas sp. BZB3]|uniref:DUF2798 domain-containing protein n=1 Tax=Pseudoalteromonas sp. BZB3 TaxID=3136670 RepID=UPI0032C41BBC
MKINLLAIVQVNYQKLVFSFFIALLMSCIVSFVITLFNVGFIENVLFIWLKTWSFTFVVAFPAINLVAPIVNKLVSLVIIQSTPHEEQS